jgi:hypothetical protein
MEYSYTSYTIQQLYDLIKEGKIDLRPQYQRNFIWSKKEQQTLIDSILHNMPLPSFFLYKKSNNTYEMVDGQQRAESICRFINGDITDSLKNKFSDIDSKRFMDYKLNITEITKVDVTSGESISSFYALVNKQGEHLNPAEINKAQYSNHPFMQLVEFLLDTKQVADIDIFTTKTKARMNDRTLIEEIVAYLYGGIYDKKDYVNVLYNTELTSIDVEQLKDTFLNVITRIDRLNSIKPINQTRYRQRNDFFTLFNFIHKHSAEISDELLDFQYNILIWIDNNNLIRPSNDECEILQKYAFSCVTQSNSKHSRETRLEILETILLNRSENTSDEYELFLEDLRDILNTDDIPLINIEGYQLIDYNRITINN